MYPAELEIKYTTESNTSVSYLDLLLLIGRDGQLRNFLYDEIDDFNFHVTNFLFPSIIQLWRVYMYLTSLTVCQC